MNKKWRCQRGWSLAFPLFLLAFSAPSQAAGVVGAGTAISCTEAALDAALIGGGAVSFNCGAAPATITFTARKDISILTSINGGNLITLSGGNAVGLFNVTGGGLSVQNIALVNGQDTALQPGATAINASAGPITVTDSTISGHHSNFGGCPAISSTGTIALTITGSTISGNVNAAAAIGFAVCAGGNSTSTISNSTFANNTGGAFETTGTATFTNATIAGNTATGSNHSGGIETVGGTITFRNSILANNVATGPALGIGQCQGVAGGVMTNGGGNLQYPNTFCSGTTPWGDPLLGPLANNGGPTMTMALGAGSAAIDQANPLNCPIVDQRGVGRQDGDGNGSIICDVGAYEAPILVAAAPAVIPTLGGAGLALLMLLLAGFAATALKRRHDMR